MIPFPNVIAGILIGIANDTWLARLIIPFAWGIVFCIYTSIARRDKRDAFVTKSENLGREAKWGMSHVHAFYFVEYMTASFTSLLFSIISGFIRGFF
jgi:hypothetical protein